MNLQVVQVVLLLPKATDDDDSTARPQTTDVDSNWKTYVHVFSPTFDSLKLCSLDGMLVTNKELVVFLILLQKEVFVLVKIHEFPGHRLKQVLR